MADLSVVLQLITDIEMKAKVSNSKTEKCKCINALTTLSEVTYRYNSQISVACDEACKRVVLAWND